METALVAKSPTFADLARHAPVLKGELPDGITVVRDERSAQVVFTATEMSPSEFIVVERVLEEVEERLGCDLTGMKWGYELAVKEDSA